MAVTYCPKCSSPMKLRNGRFGQFYGCTNFPKCNGISKFKGQPQKIVSHAEGALFPFAPTAEQTTIWNEVKNGNTHVMVKAFAGTGKSTTMRIAMFKADPSISIFYGCFGKKNVEEFVEKGTPGNATVKTLNSIGGAQVRRAFPKSKLDKNKVWNIIEILFPAPEKQSDVERVLRNNITAAIFKLVGLCKSHVLTHPTGMDLAELALRHDVEFETETTMKFVFELVPQIMVINNDNTAIHDFDDQIFWPVSMNLPVQKFDMVIVDEAQDMNPAQHLLVSMMLHQNSRCIIIGDDNQAIFGFRGSDVDSMENMVALLEKSKPVKELTLSITQRCPKAIVALAQAIVPGIVARSDAIEGEVIDTDEKAVVDIMEPGDMGICRTNAPLVPVAFRLLKAGKKVVILGRDIAEGLVKVIDKMQADSVADLLEKVQNWSVKECDKFKNSRDAESKMQVINDKADCIYAFCEFCDTVNDVKQKIRAIYCDEENGKVVGAITFSSVHKAKGLEADRVFWIQPDITCKSDQDWQAGQEENLKYVATTRARKVLYRVKKAGKATAKPAAASVA